MNCPFEQVRNTAPYNSSSSLFLCTLSPHPFLIHFRQKAIVPFLLRVLRDRVEKSHAHRVSTNSLSLPSSILRFCARPIRRLACLRRPCRGRTLFQPFANQSQQRPAVKTRL